MKTAHPRNLPDNGNRTLRNPAGAEARGRLGTPGLGGEDPNCRDGSRLGADPSWAGWRAKRSAGQFSRRGPPTGIARERETRVDDAEPCQCECRPTFAVKMQPHAGPPPVQMAPAARERRPPVGTAARRAAAAQAPTVGTVPISARTSQGRAAREAERRPVLPVGASDRHRAGARNPHRPRYAPPI